MPEEKRRAFDWLVNLVARAFLGTASLLPYERRLAFMAWVGARLVFPLAGYNRRIRENLALVCPELSRREVRRITREVGANAGRMLAEMYAPEAFRTRVARSRLTGPGLAVLEEARAEGRPVIAVSGHFGSYDAARVAFEQAGHPLGVIYRPMANGFFNAHYAEAMNAMARPTFVQSRKGLALMLRHLRAGGNVALLTDQRDENGARLGFFGKPVLTPLSAAEMALKYDALLLPVYGIRRENGLDFDIVVEEPIPPGDPRDMMQAANDSLEARVRSHMGQWLWSHRRWKMPADREQVAQSRRGRGLERG